MEKKPARHKKKGEPCKLRKIDWRRHLHSGDEITWNDPDDDACSRTGTLLSIQYFGDSIASITLDDGWQCEVFLHELS